MLTQIIEFILRNILNFAAKRRQASEPKDAPIQSASKPLPAHSWLLGYEIAPGDNDDSAKKPVSLTLNDIRRHMHVTGSSGCGKTTGLLSLIAYLLNENITFIVVDMRGDFIDRVKQLVASNSIAGSQRNRLRCIDLRNESVAFNPLAGSGDAHSRAQGCLGALRARSLNWGVQIEETLYASLLALASVDPPYTLLEVAPLLTNPLFRQHVLSYLADPYVQDWFDRYEHVSAEQQQALSSAALNKLTPLLAMPQVRRMFGQRETVPFRTIIDTPGSIVLIGLNVSALHHAACLTGSLLVSSIIQAALSRVDVPEGDITRPPVALIIDEFENVANPEFAEVIQEGRRFGIFACLSHQNISQLPPYLTDLVATNSHLHLAYQTGASDAARIAKEVGGDDEKTIRSRLLKLPVGQAFLIERGGDTRLVNMIDTKIPAKNPNATACDAGSDSVSAKDIDAEIASRLTQFAFPPKSAESRRSTKAGKPVPDKKPEEGATYEIRPKSVRPIKNGSSTKGLKNDQQP